MRVFAVDVASGAAPRRLHSCIHWVCVWRGGRGNCGQGFAAKATPRFGIFRVRPGLPHHHALCVARASPPPYSPQPSFQGPFLQRQGRSPALPSPAPHACASDANPRVPNKPRRQHTERTRPFRKTTRKARCEPVLTSCARRGEVLVREPMRRLDERSEFGLDRASKSQNSPSRGRKSMRARGLLGS